jgi:hypothetical protein
VSLFGNLLCTEVEKLGEYMGLDPELLHIPPADGLTGKTDSEVLGISYEEFDAAVINGEVGWDWTKKVMYGEHKRKPIPTYCPSVKTGKIGWMRSLNRAKADIHEAIIKLDDCNTDSWNPFIMDALTTSENMLNNRMEFLVKRT